ncbi:MAG: methyl-accepting chemotaxis protein [Thermodesulfobacteriota bacterium]
MHSLSSKVIVLVALFASFMAASVGITFYILSSQSLDARVIDIAGRQRMLTQKMTKEAFALLAALERKGDVEAVRSALSKTVSLYDRSLNALKDGGTTLGTNGKETTLPASSGDVAVQLERVGGLWHIFNGAIDIILKNPGLAVSTPAVAEAITQVKEGNIPLLKESNKAVVLLKHATESKTALLKSVQVGALLSMLLLAVASVVLSRKILLKPIKRLADMLKDICDGEGDLTKRVDIVSKDEIGELAHHFNSFVDQLEGMIGDISTNTRTLADSSSQLFETSGKISSGSESQSEKTTQVAAASEEMSATIVEVSRNATIAAQAAGEANEAANDGANIVSMTIESMNGIAMSARESSAIIATLGNSSQEIDKIIKVIEDIADQTNLLALNAAIEAARAGEQGRGFAVVADEVRKLAERTTKATKEIGSMITSIQSETETALTSMESEVKVVEEGVARAQHAGESLTKIASEVENVTTMIKQIASATEEQSTAADIISGDIETVASITRTITDGSHEINGASDEIAQRANALKQMVGAFKVRERANIVPLHRSPAPLAEVAIQEAV